MQSSRVTKRTWGRTAEGQDVTLFTISNDRGAQIELLDWGATVRSFLMPTAVADPKVVDVVLGYDNFEEYQQNRRYFGCTVGRVCNRIKNGRFTLDGVEYQLATNNGPNHLHGGVRGYGHRMWTATDIGNDQVTFEIQSPDGDEGYPGQVTCRVTYRLPIDSNRLIVQFRAEASGKTTPINLTNHSYFNLNGVHRSSTVHNHLLTILADSYLPTDSNGLVTGEVRRVDNTPYDFRSSAVLGDRLKLLEPLLGLDNHFCKVPTDTPERVASLYSKETGLRLTVFATQPGLQVYTANFVDDKNGKQACYYGKHSAICFETQHYPDSVNNKHFPEVWLRPGTRYEQTAIYEFTTEKC